MAVWDGFVKRLREGIFTGGGGYDPDANLQASQGGSPFFRKLTATNRDLPQLTWERSTELAFWLYQSNPLARRILRLVRDFAIGDGVQVVSSNDNIQAVIDDFWNDPFNRLDMKLFDRILELGLFGELCWSVKVNPVDGSVRLGIIDPANISKVITDPSNIEDVRAIKLKIASSVSGGELASITEDRIYKVIRIDDDPNSNSYGRLMGVLTDGKGEIVEKFVVPDSQNVAKTEIPYAGACFFFKVNSVANTTRGWSDLLSLVDWIDAFDQALFNEVDRSLLLKNFIWDVTLDGANDAVIEAYMKKTAPPNPGSLRVHNEKVKWEAVTPDLKTVDAQNSADLLLSYIATGSGLPKLWLNATDDVNRSTAAELGEPAYKELSARQKYVGYIIENVLTFVLDQAELKGKLRRRKTRKGSIAPEPWDFDVNTPEIRSKDLSAAAEVLSKMVSALAVAKSEGAIDVKVEQDVLTMLLTNFGVNLDMEEVRQRMEKEKAAQEPDVGPGLPPPNGNGEAVVAAKREKRQLYSLK